MALAGLFWVSYGDFAQLSVVHVGKSDSTAAVGEFSQTVAGSSSKHQNQSKNGLVSKNASRAMNSGSAQMNDAWQSEFPGLSQVTGPFAASDHLFDSENPGFELLKLAPSRRVHEDFEIAGLNELESDPTTEEDVNPVPPEQGGPH